MKPVERRRRTPLGGVLRVGGLLVALGITVNAPAAAQAPQRAVQTPQPAVSAAAGGSVDVLEFEFLHQPIRDILQVFAHVGGFSLLADDSVEGFGSFAFRRSDIDSAYRRFLAAHHLFLRVDGGFHYVSRIAIAQSSVDNTLSIRAENVTVEQLVRTLARTVGQTILFDALPTQHLSIYSDNLSPMQALQLVTRRLPDFVIETDQAFWYLRRRATAPEGGPQVVRADVPTANQWTTLPRTTADWSRTAAAPVPAAPAAPLQQAAPSVLPADSPSAGAGDRPLPPSRIVTPTPQRPEPTTAAPANASADTRVLNPPPFTINTNADGYGVSVDTARFSELVPALLRRAGKQFSIYSTADATIRNIEISPRPFDAVLAMVLERFSMAFVVEQEVYLVAESNRRDVIRTAAVPLLIPLQRVTVAELLPMIPAGLLPTNGFKSDPLTNTLILFGLLDELRPLRDFIAHIEAQRDDYETTVIDGGALAPAQVLPLLPDSLAGFRPRPIPGTNSFVVSAPEAANTAIRSLVALANQPLAAHATDVVEATLPLQWIRAADFVAALPHAIGAETLRFTADGRFLYFRGPAAALAAVRDHAQRLDRPQATITYDVLVLQFHETDSVNWSVDLTGNDIDAESNHSVFGRLGNLLNINFDVLTTLGLAFAARLNAEIANNRVSVVADTRLIGSSGSEIRFQNTDTFRYRDSVEPASSDDRGAAGVTRELSSGLFLTVTGTTVGSNHIDLATSLTLSNRGIDSQPGTPPPTSERMVTNRVLAAAGRPVVIARLVQQSADERRNPTPLLSLIPLLGHLFTAQRTSAERTELVAIVVPRIEPPDGITPPTATEAVLNAESTSLIETVVGAIEQQVAALQHRCAHR